MLSLWALACGLQHGFVEQLFLAFGSGFAELREGFVEFALDRGLVAEEELRFGDLGRVYEEIGEGGVRVGFGVVLQVGVDPVVEDRRLRCAGSVSFSRRRRRCGRPACARSRIAG